MALRNDGKQAKEILLKTAAKVFAKHGYRKATNEMLCSACGMNAASVNYYFGSKRELYRQAWRYAYSEARKICPFDGGISVDAPPEERLKGRIKALVALYTDERFDCGQMIAREMENTVNMLEELWDTILTYSHQLTEDIVNAYMEGMASPEDVKKTSTLIITMCRVHYLAQKGKIRVGDTNMSREDVTEWAYDFVTRSLSAWREELRKEKKAAPTG